MKKDNKIASESLNEVNEESLSEVSGGVNRLVQFRAVTKDQAKDYQKHGSTVVKIDRPGVYKMDNGQRIDIDPSYFNDDGYALLLLY